MRQVFWLCLTAAALLRASGQLQQCAECPCSRLLSQAARGDVELLVTRSRDSGVSLTTVDINALYRVRLRQTSTPFKDFFVCTVGVQKTTSGSFPSRYLPLQARLMAACSNVVTSAPSFVQNPGTLGEMQYLWKSPEKPGDCVLLSACVQLASGPSQGRWVHRGVRVCTAGGTSTPGPVGPQPPVKTTPPTPQVTPAPRTSPPFVPETRPPTTPRPVSTVVTTRQPRPPPIVTTPQPVSPPEPTPSHSEFVAFSAAGTGPMATDANVPSQGVVMTYPGPLLTPDVTVAFMEDTGVSPTVLYEPGHFYMVRARSTRPYKSCFMSVTAQPLNGQSPGEFVGKTRQGNERRYQGYANLVECSAGRGLRTASSSAFWQAPTDTPCVQVSVYLEMTDGELTRVDSSFCRMHYKTGAGACPLDLAPAEACSQCNANSNMYFAHTGPKPLCCNGLPVGPNQQCCGGTIQPGTLGRGWLCCGNKTVFNPEEATCCRGNKQLGRASDVFCCETKSFSPSSVLTRSREARCCGSEAFDPLDKLCCGGSLHSTWPGVLGTQMACCPWDGLPFNPTTHNCMLCRGSPSRVIQPKSIPLNCCGTKPYNQTDQVCCDFQNEVLQPAPYTRTGCCNGQVFNRDNSMCCLGSVARAPPGQTITPSWRCCETQAFDPSTHECLECSGFRRLVRTNEAWSCCGINSFSRLSAVCCNGQVLELGRTFTDLLSMPSYSCCGRQPFDPATQTCCSLQDSAVVDRRGTSCCGTGAVYNTLLGERCIQCQGGQPEVLQSADQRICCGRSLYDPSKSACCVNPLRSVDLAPTRARSATPRLFCCNGVAFDANEEKCCPNANNIVSASALC